MDLINVILGLLILLCIILIFHLNQMCKKIDKISNDETLDDYENNFKI